MLLVRPKRGLEKPRGAVSIDWGHPLATGLSVLMPFTEGGGVHGTAERRELLCATGGVIPETNDPANCSWVNGVEGKGLKLNNINANVQLTGAGVANFMPLDRITVLIIKRHTDSTLREACSFGFAIAASNTGHVGGLIPNSTGGWYWRFGATPGNVLFVAGVGKTTNVERCAFTAGGRGLFMWRNGVLIGSSGTAVTRSSNPSTTFYVNRGLGSSVLGDLQEIYFFAICAAEWSPDMIAWWMAEPYGMFVPAKLPVAYFIPTETALKQPRIFVAT